MSDIVKRLRIAECTPNHQYGCVCHQAANEIERLRQEIDMCSSANEIANAQLAEAEALLRKIREEVAWEEWSDYLTDRIDAFLARRGDVKEQE